MKFRTTNFYVEFPELACSSMPRCLIADPIERVDHVVGTSDRSAAPCGYEITKIRKVVHDAPSPP